MSFLTRSFVEFLIKKIESKGILGSNHSDGERERDVIDMIWEAYEEFK